MADKMLRQFYLEHEGKVSDKWPIYFAEYDRYFQEYRNNPIRLLEIGVQNGGSLEIWSRYFKEAQRLVGCDINPDCARLKYNDHRIAIVIGDANEEMTGEEIFRRASAFDIVIDDGSHRSSDIVKSFAKYFPHISDGGLFVAEDLHCSYWREYEGGLFDPFSSMAFFKRLADICNHEHWGVDRNRTDILKAFFEKYGFKIDEEVLAHIHSVDFVNSMCFVRKKNADLNKLGKRLVAGADAVVLPQIASLQSSDSLALDQSHNQWTTTHFLPEEQLPLLSARIMERDKKLIEYKKKLDKTEKEVAALNEAVAAMRNSTSWRITGPVRALFISMRRLNQQRKRVVNAIKSTPNAIELVGDAGALIAKAGRVYRSEGLTGIKRGVSLILRAQRPNRTEGSDGFDRNDYSEWIRRYDTLNDGDCAAMREVINGWPRKPLISVLMPVYNPRPEWLIEAIESVRGQIYTNWELCIAEDASTNKKIRRILEDYAKRDSRIKVVFRTRNGHISAASNSALELVAGEWVALLDHDDVLAKHALFWVAEAITRNPDIRLIYSDEDKINRAGKRFNPYFKPDWNVDLCYSQNMFSHLGVYSAALLQKVGGFRLGFEGSQDYDLVLRCIEQVNPTQIFHIPRVLYHWRVHTRSAAYSMNAKPYAALAAERALNEHFERSKISANAEFIGHGYRISYPLPDDPPLVSLIIPTKNGLQLIRQCISSIVEKTTYPNYEILIVDNGSDDPQTLEYFMSLKSDPRIQILRDERPFNYSALNNAAVTRARGELVALINNDIEVITPDWLSEMVSHAIRPGVGAVGARLWYPNDKLQHGGVVLGIGGVAGHSHKYLERDNCGYFGRAVLAQRFSAVTAACLVIRKAIYEEVGGLNENDLRIAFNDVDFCLRVMEAGYHNLWTPFAELYHHESATRGAENTPEKQERFMKEVHHMLRNWGVLLENDPAYNPNLTLLHEDFSLAWPPRVAPLLSTMPAGERKIA